MKRYFIGSRHNPVLWNGHNYEQSDIYIFKDCGVTAIKVMSSPSLVEYVSVSICCYNDFLGQPDRYYAHRLSIEDYTVFHSQMLLCPSSEDFYKLICKFDFK